MKYFLLFSYLALFQPMFSQQNTNEFLWIVKTDDFQKYEGIAIDLDSISLTLKTQKGDTISIPVKEINSIKKREVEVKMPVVFTDAHSSVFSRYMYGENGFGLDKGEGYYQNRYLLINDAGYGITEHLSMSVIFIPYPIASESLIFDAFIAASADLHFSFDYFAFGFKGILGKTFESTNNSTHFNSLSHYVTFGTEDYNLTLEAATITPTEYSFGEHQGYSSVAQLSLRTMARFTNTTRFLFQLEYITVNLDDKTLLAAPGFRSTWNKVSFDYGLIHVFDLYIYGYHGSETPIPFLPWLALTVAF